MIPEKYEMDMDELNPAVWEFVKQECAAVPEPPGLKDRLRAANVKCGYLDGRPTENAPADLNTMLAAVAQMRWAARATDADGVVFAIPYLDIMTAIDGGWNNISREAVPLLYENPASVWLGFQDPSLPLLPIAEKVFGKRHVIDVPYRTSVMVPPPVNAEPL